MKNTGLIFVFLIVLAQQGMAQKLSAGVSKNKVVVGENFQLSFTLNTNGSNFKAPNLNDFDVYSGPNQSSSMSFVNGVMSQSITLSYILAAKKEGKFTIGPATVLANGNTLSSNPIVIEVGKGNPSNATAPNGGNAQNPTAPNTENVSDNLFVRTSVSKSSCYLGESVTVTQKVYTRYQLRGFQDYKFPDYNGFFVQEYPINPQIQLTTENVDGVNYQVAELKRTFVFAQRTGTLEIEPMMVECVIRKQSNRRPRDIFEQMFGGGYEDAVVTLKSKPVSITVLPLPDKNKPADFEAAVGDFSFKAHLSKDKVKANDGIDLVVSINGKGNLKLIDPPKFQFPEDFETYDPKVTDNVSVTTNGVSGSKTFDYLLIPRHEGDYKLSDLHFSYFDPAKKDYVSLPLPEFAIHVDPGDANAAAIATHPNNKQDVKILGADIHYNKRELKTVRTKNTYFFGSASYYSLMSLPFLAFIGFVFIRKRNEDLNSDPVAVKSRKAQKMAKKRLSVAEKHLQSNSKELFYAELSNALYGYLTNKLNLPLADMNKETIVQLLQQKQLSGELIQRWIGLLDNCEYARYAPGSVSGDLASIYSQTIDLITQTEHGIQG